MKKLWHKENNDPTSNNPLTITREQSKYEIFRFSDRKSCFVDRRPRRDSKFWKDYLYTIWDLRENHAAYLPKQPRERTENHGGYADKGE